jgi:hypothetical protein
MGKQAACQGQAEARTALPSCARWPSVSASELSSAADVGRPMFYAVLKTLEERCEIAKEQMLGEQRATASPTSRRANRRRAVERQRRELTAAALTRHSHRSSRLLPPPSVLTPA